MDIYEAIMTRKSVRSYQSREVPEDVLKRVFDAAIAVDHIALCVAAEGLGTCWIGAFYEDEVKRILGIPPAIRVVALLPLGYPRDPKPVRKLRLSLERIVSYESWKLE